MKVINIIGCAGTGKSTTAFGILYVMKSLGMKVEYADEYAKALVYDERENTLNDQLYVLAKQNQKLSRLVKSGTEFVVTDTSLLLGIVYSKNPSQEFVNLVNRTFNQYDNQTFYIPRNQNYAYDSGGRRQSTVEEADRSAKKIEEILPTNTIRLEPSDNYVIPILGHLGIDYKIR